MPFSITHSSKKVMAVTCTHGMLIDPDAEREILRIRREFKPDIALHLGDWLDTQSFMTGGGKEAKMQSIADDVAEGIRFLKEYEPHVICAGNHDYRLWKDAESGNEHRAYAASAVIEKLEYCFRGLHARHIPYTGALGPEGWIKIGPVVFGHGVMYNEQAARDHAEALASYADYVVVGHTHRIMMQSGRTVRPTIGYSIGCACNKAAMGYAKGRRATMAWQHAVLKGEILGDNIACLNIVPLHTEKLEPMPEILV